MFYVALYSVVLPHLRQFWQIPAIEIIYVYL